MKNGKLTRAELARYNACYKCRKADATSHICTEFGVPLSWCCPTEQCYNEMHEFSLNSADHYDDGTPMSISPDFVSEPTLAHDGEGFCGNCQHCSFWSDGFYHCTKHGIVDPDDASCKDFISYPF